MSEKSGIELIAQERAEQIEKHGRTVIKDVALNSNFVGPFKILPLIIGVGKLTGVVGGLPWPENWDEQTCEKWKPKAK